jgi:protein-L-isoaspartate(D-aspartate) O-methyltransferase
MNIEECRRFYAEEIQFAAHLRSRALVDAFARVPRERFLGPGPWQTGSPDAKAMAALGMCAKEYLTLQDPRQLYHNMVILIDAGRDLNNGQPGALAAWIEALDLKPGHRVYHLGSGVGYYTAIMAEVVGPQGRVMASEVEPELAARAQENLSSYPNVTVHSGDGSVFDPGDCDAMLINAGVTHPATLWLDRLQEGGRLVVPITFPISKTLGSGLMIKIIRRQAGFAAEVISPAAIYSCTSMRDPAMEPVLGSALATLFKVKSLRRDAHERTETCLVHGKDVCFSRSDAGASQDESASNSAAVSA